MIHMFFLQRLYPLGYSKYSRICVFHKTFLTQTFHSSEMERESFVAANDLDGSFALLKPGIIPTLFILHLCRHPVIQPIHDPLDILFLLIHIITVENHDDVLFVRLLRLRKDNLHYLGLIVLLDLL